MQTAAESVPAIVNVRCNSSLIITQANVADPVGVTIARVIRVSDLTQ